MSSSNVTNEVVINSGGRRTGSWGTSPGVYAHEGGSLWVQVEGRAFQAEGNTMQLCRNPNYNQAEESLKEIDTPLLPHFTYSGRVKS